MTSTQKKVLLRVDPEKHAVFVQQGLVVHGFILNPWPDTDAEIEAQAFAQVPLVDDDVSRLPTPDNIRREATEL